MKIPLTLCIIHDTQDRKNRVLLGLKKKGFGAGRWNGFGGKLEPGETIEQAAKREILEESGVTVETLEKMGVMIFEFEGKPDELLEVHIYRAESWSGEPREGDEMKPQWFDISEVPFKNMWPDDKYWLPFFLQGKKFTGRFLFGLKDSIIEFNLKLVQSFNN